MSAIPAAFLIALEEHIRQEDAGAEPDNVQYQISANAYEGGLHRVIACGGHHEELDPNFVAAKLLAAFDKLTCLAADVDRGGALSSYGDIVFSAMEAIRTAWRMMDANGGDGMRPFARFVGIVEKSDEFVWEREAQRGTIKEAA